MEKLTDTLAVCVGLPLLSLTERGEYHTAIFAAPASLDDLRTYVTYGQRLSKFGLSMARWGVDLTRWQVEVVFSET